MHEILVPIRPRYGEVDSMGVVYHAHYLVYFELGRTEFMRAQGIAYANIEDRGFRLAVVDAQVSYRKPALYDQELTVATWVSSVSRASVIFEYQLRNTDGAVLATGTTRLGCLSKANRPTRLPGDIIAALGAIPGRTTQPVTSEEAS